ncbi:MAG: AAA family ATPase [Chloroflexota bacterium]|nr:AAA family ATPase [Chloroflexota bacterium]
MTPSAPLAARRVFLAATGQNRGKTTASLGLIAGFSLAGHRLGFLKPVGQRYLVVDGTRADEDAILIREVCGLSDALNDMSPVTLPRHFTTDYIMGKVYEDLPAQVLGAFARVAAGKDLVVIEGTGHAGVGAVVGLSNAAAAALLESKVIIVSEGGIGRPIDEIVLNASLFEHHGVEVIGAIVNKVDLGTHPDAPEILRRGLAQHRIDLIGCIPFSDLLANPSLELIVTHLDGELLSGVAAPGKTIGQVVIGAMQAEHAVAFFRDRTLVITPGDRQDLVRAAIAAGPARVMGLILTGGFRPPDDVLSELRAANLFAFLVGTDTLTTAQAANAILVKTHPTDVEKIATIIDLVSRSIDIGALLARL